MAADVPADTAFRRALDALEARGPGRMIPDLDRITQLASLLGDPQLAYPSVHVTGTNGKGSVVRMVGALCAAAGMSAGTYTSPHLQTVRERFTIAGRHISPRRFAEVHDEIAALAELVDHDAQARHREDRVTYFEYLTAMAYWWFADAPVDVGVFEVGMGGRWDATNLVRGDVAVLNMIDVDHAQLGRTPVEAAREKAGIIKPGAQVVTAHQRPDVRAVIDDAVAAADATLLAAGRDLDVVDRQVAVGGQVVALRVGDRVVDDVLLPLFGTHMADNAALALAAFAALTGDAFDRMDDDVIRHGLGAAVVPGRLEIVHRDPTVVLDVAHNPSGAAASAGALEESFGFRELVLVAACFDDKDIPGILEAFRDVASHVVVTTAPSPRAASLERMRAAAVATWEGTGTAVEVADTVPAALSLAEATAGPGDGILVAGSLVTAGAARDLYLPVDPGDDEVVVVTPEDEDEPLDQADVDELAQLLEDEDTFRAALDHLLDDAADEHPDDR